jgi:hypothetical protein
LWEKRKVIKMDRKKKRRKDRRDRERVMKRRGNVIRKR